MFKRIADHRIQFGRCQIEALNKPKGWEIFDGEQELSISRIKFASIDKSQDLGGYDLTHAIKEYPDHLFVKVFAIKKDEVNDNGDAFGEDELKKAAHTFIGVPVFCNHQNDDIEKARGNVVHAWYDDEKGGIWIISRVDRTAYPKLSRGIEEGYINATSMGAQVHHSLCSICHNHAHVAEEYCDHVRNRKTKRFSGKTKCAYHASKNKPEDNCPICDCEKGSSKSHEYTESQIYEHNFGLKFIEDSFVVNPACHDCLVDCVLNVPEFNKKVAEVQLAVAKVTKALGTEKMEKIAGQLELQYLNKAMKMMEVVAKSMMAQKEQVSMEYVSDIVDVLASLQTATDELVEMGYGQLQSPPSLENPDLISDAVPVDPTTQQATGGIGVNPQSPPQQAAAPSTGGAATSPTGIGNVTKPTFSPTAGGKLKELLKEGTKLREKISHLSEEITKVISNSQNNKEPAIMADKTEKVAAGEGASQEQHQMTTQKQLDEFSKKDVLHGRTDTAPDGVTESDQQLGLKKEPVNDTTSQSGQVRQNKFPEETTNGQFDRPVFGEGFIERWNSYPDTITEKTWREFDRAVGAVLSTDQKEHTTQAQLEDLRSHHRWTEPNFATESQLASDKNWRNPDNAWLSKDAAATYSKQLITSAIEALADAIVIYKRTPAELVKAAQFITKDPASHMKAAFITLVNGLPTKKAARFQEAKRARYFDKIASEGSATDYLLACMGDHCLNLKAEELVDAVRYVALDPKKMSAVESKAQEKNASELNIEDSGVVDKFAAFESAFNDITNSDGIHEVRFTAKEAGAMLGNDGLPIDSNQFIKVAEAYARKTVAASDVVLYSVELDPTTGTIHAQLKEQTKLSAAEKEAMNKQASVPSRSASRASMVKDAQMMGGEMGGQGGAGGAPGAGASVPAPPAGGQAPPAPPMESMEAQPGEEMGDEAGGDLEAEPPGSICPVCGSEDVDIVDGKGKCNNCNSQFVFKVEVEVTRWTGVNDKNSDEMAGGDEGGLGGDEGGEGFPMPDAGAGGDVAEGAPNIPVAAMTKLHPDTLKKLASSVRLGSISPLTGSTNTHHLGGTEYLCLDTGSQYGVHMAVDKNNPKGAMFVEWRWTPKTAASNCPSCRRTRTAFNKALKSQGISDVDFDSMSFKKKADTVLAMHNKGLFQIVKTASKNASVTGEFKKAYTVNGKFPIESCREKLARRYGENSVAISGPCRGEKIHDCVCNQLKSANIYSDRVALKIADVWSQKDACVECMEDYVRFGYELEKAATVCQHLKVRYASDEELFAEDMTDAAPMGGDTQGVDVAVDTDLDNADPFGDSGMGTGPEDQVGGGALGEMGPESADPAGGVGGDGMGQAEVNGDELDISGQAPEMGIPGASSGETVTIEIPMEAVKKLIIDKLSPGSGVDDLGTGPVDVPLGGDIGGIAEEAVEGLGDALDGDDLGDSDEDGGEEVPVDDNGPSDFGGGGGEESVKKDEGDSSGFGETDHTDNKEPFVDDQSDNKDGNDFDNKEANHLANVMKKGKRVGQIDLDLSKVMAALKKNANEVTPTVEPSQKVVDKYQDGKTMGHENKFDPSKPSVPRAQATMGAEASDLNPKDKPLPKIPAGGGEMGHEAELGYTNDKPNMSGGLNGAGKTDTAKSKNPQKTAQQKQASEKKIAPKEPVGDEVPFEFSANKDHANTPDHLKRTPFEESDHKEIKSIPEKGEGAFMGDEKSSIEFVPKAPKDQPSIPVGGGRSPKYDKNEKNAPELQDKIKGTVIANDEKSRENKKEAFRIAARMLESKMIEASELMEKVAQLQRYDIHDLKLLEGTIFKSANKKGLATAPDGIEGSPVVISEASNQRSAQSDLKNALQSLFKLDRHNKIASELTDDDLRNTGDPQRRSR